ncbi:MULTISPECIES: PucR family transcriptional regulator [Streptomyces]|uniref:Helix-turn-helix domain-containing protein n=1 Tax=Streptomyces solicathayae TaxID=3081768 RepID=A0ABZ0M2V5_9ACTN|nr:helix-turn-helix domain-containing protein [Streptomyces sp. HUAS YS2]WOX26109.1 helix-turn-helix domain-containing protein [Streptomyces sp. HUAS YS2]
MLHAVQDRPVDVEAVAALHRAAHVLMADLPGLCERLLAALTVQQPAYRAALAADPSGVRQEVRASLRYHVRSLMGPGRPSRPDARRCADEVGASWAARGLPLDAVLQAFRLGGAMVWQELVDETARRDPDDVRLLVHVAADVWNFVDEHCTLVADAHRRAARRTTGGPDDRLRRMTAALLDGTTRIADLPEVAAALGLTVEGAYAVVAATGADVLALRNAAPDGGPRIVWHADGDTAYGLVPVAEGTLRTLARSLHGPPGTPIGIGSPVETLAAVGDARRLAEVALRACPPDGGTVLLDEHLPAALLASSPALAATLAERVLGPVLRLDPGDRDLLIGTLSAWLDCEGSAQRAAVRLYCHRNTVLNRLRRLEQLTGRSLTRPADVVELSLALTARCRLRL